MKSPPLQGHIMAEKQHDDIIDRVFRAARDVGYVLVGKQAPLAFHRHGDNTPDRADAEEELREAVDALRAGLGLRGHTAEDMVQSLDMQGGPAWRRKALGKVIRAKELVYKRNEHGDREALGLLGEAVWAKQKNEPIPGWEQEIKEVWPTPPAQAESKT
jgi:hypothetical protein